MDPLADVETIETELLYADLEQAERRLERVAKQAKVGRQGAGGRGALAARGGRGAARGPGRCAPCRAPDGAPAAPTTRLAALTSKPVLYVANVAEGEPLEPPPALVEHAAARGRARHGGQRAPGGRAGRAADDEAAAMREELGVRESGSRR